MNQILAGIDIGGTKCAAVLGQPVDGGIRVLERLAFPTPGTPDEALEGLMSRLEQMLEQHGDKQLAAIGVSCGSPLDSKSGLVLSPPNLPNWHRVDAVTPFERRFGVPAALQNDANACALAEWKWGAGQGCNHMIFLTFGTGMGAGLILDGKLYTGTNDMAGEVGHVRMAEDGPVGYGKAGSFEGFCSGGGIARLARAMTEAHVAGGGRYPSYCPRGAEDLPLITARSVGEAAQAGDSLALEIYAVVGRKLGRGLAMLVDILNPQRIVIGSIYGRQLGLLEPLVMEVLREEALDIALARCTIVPAGLGESVGDLASLSVALNRLEG